MWPHEDVGALKDCPPVCRVRAGGFEIQASPRRLFFPRMNGYIFGLDHAGVWADAKKGNHWPRRMGYHGSVGNGAGRARAASTATPAAHSHGRYQEAFGHPL